MVSFITLILIEDVMFVNPESFSQLVVPAVLRLKFSLMYMIILLNLSKDIGGKVCLKMYNIGLSLALSVQ